MKNYLIRPEPILFFIYLICFAAGMLYFFTEMDTLSLLDQLPDICIFKRLTGLKCPGCGMTHAFICLGRFQLGEAIRHNIFSVFLFYGGVAWLIHPKKVQIKVSNRIMVFLFVMVMIYWVIRNMDLVA
jgi:hypothetical protein